MNSAQALRNLVDVRDALESFGARPFLVDGTLLGHVREGGFIAHDTDIDLGLFVEELRPEMARAVAARGFRVHRTFGTPGRGFQWSFKRHAIKVDVFVYYRSGDVLYHAAWQKGEPIRYEYPTFGLERVRFLGHEFWAPADPEAFLATKYGPDWRVPVIMEWDWAWGPANAMEWDG